MQSDIIAFFLRTIYCLPISHLFFYTILATIAYLFLFRLFHPSIRFLWLCIICYIFLILAITLGIREASDSQGFCLIPFASIFVYLQGQTEKLRESFMNVVLFYPLGLLLGSVSKRKRMIGVGFLLSLTIEVSQYLFRLGYAETDDVIHNTLGTAIGALLMLWVRKRGQNLK